MAPHLRLPVLAGIVLISSALAACSRPTQPAAAPESTQPAAVNPAAVTAAGEGGWAEILGPAPAPENWQIFPCDNPVLLCVAARGELIGTVERFSYSLEDAPVAPGTVPPTDLEKLQALVAEHYSLIEQDRATADAALRFAATTPTPAAVGRLPGLRYGYTVTHPNGALFEQTVGYMAIAGDQVYVFVTGVTSGDPSGSFSTAADLQTFEPYLDAIIEGLSL